MPNPIRYDLHECNAVRFRTDDNYAPTPGLIALARKWLAQRLGLHPFDRGFFEVEERIDEAAFQAYIRGCHTEDGGVML
jgi:hypothetical protein